MKTFLWSFFILNVISVFARPPLELENDERKLVEVAEFGYLAGGQLNLTVENYKLSNESSPGMVAFYIRKGHSVGNAFSDENHIQPSRIVRSCYLENSFVKDEQDDQVAEVREIPLSGLQPWTTSLTVGDHEEGVWEVLLVNCKDSLISLKLTVNEVNPGNNHLPAGDSPLPLVYGLSSLIYLSAALYWTTLLIFGKDTKVFRAHWLMLILMITIVINKSLQSAKYHYMKIGLLSEGWSIGFYVFASIKGLLSVFIIVLLASGWMFIKPFLSTKDKRVISIVVPLQILSNVASAIGSEAAIGSVDWPFWNMMFPIVDLVACGIVLWTILQTRKNLGAGSSADGKETDVLEKYKLWSTFYVVTLIYFYVTRIVVQLLQFALPFQYVTWLGEAVNEAATLSFYIFIGWKFRPYANNPYMQVANDDLDEEEDDHIVNSHQQASLRLQPVNRRD
ncbi:lung seven transmembrane receptor-domain-containing protein [Halteromyces radiatus]|uniref:lung seven transmembrane receptor-domain-containing protein n=1 Tax=Halteromyces radiatus TaxID=101107 RepID=UPI00221E6347|nr:lung seven transmembrane receptor-domain-containing protein [Halteromyces radiatus]KAI8089974.1 lung seven transmembrane receptor-domain-containing protein [Halteromyces radiatus]